MAENITVVPFLTNLGEFQFLDNLVILNTDFPTNYLNISMFVVTIVLVLFVNLAVLLWVKVKDRVLVDKMVTMDCISNIMLLLMVFMAFPWRVRGNEIVCAGITFFRGFTLTLNRWEGLPWLLTVERVFPDSCDYDPFIFVTTYGKITQPNSGIIIGKKPITIPPASGLIIQTQTWHIGNKLGCECKAVNAALKMAFRPLLGLLFTTRKGQIPAFNIQTNTLPLPVELT
jgi:hypothetical protein